MSTRNPHRRPAWGEQRRARRNADAARVRRAQVAKRALPALRDPTLTRIDVNDRLIDHVIDIIDADPQLCEWVEQLIEANYVRPGRPREFPIRTALVLFTTQVIANRNLLQVGVEALMSGISYRKRRELGIDYVTKHDDTKQISYNQLVDVFHSIARCMDAWDHTLVGNEDEDLTRQHRAGALQEFVERLVTASTRVAGPGCGEYATDATMKWSYERPPGSGGKKIDRRGNDGNDGSPARLEDIMDGEPFTDNEPTKVVRRTAPKKNWPNTWSLGAEWAGRPNKTKSVHGYAYHSMVRCGDNEPALIDTFTITPAAAHPARSLMPILRRLEQRRRLDPTLPAGTPPMSMVVADPGYSAATIDDWQLPLQDLGIEAVFRPHRTNQEPPRWVTVGKGATRGDVLFFGGRPMCECAAHHDAIDARFPKWPFTVDDLAEYRNRVRPLTQFEWAPNGAAKPNGNRQFLAPHTTGPDGGIGGCPHCTQADGQPATLPNGTQAERCCQKRSRTFSRVHLALYQHDTVGLEDWGRKWGRRSIVEGSYGVMRNRSILDWGRDFHHFVGLARETLVAAFATVAYNFHMYRSWQARHRILEPDETHDPFSPHHLAATIPHDLADRLHGEQVLADDPGSGPRGLEYLGAALGPPG